MSRRRKAQHCCRGGTGAQRHEGPGRARAFTSAPKPVAGVNGLSTRQSSTRAVDQDVLDRRRLAHLADVALATGLMVCGRWRSSDVALIPDVLRERDEPVLGPLPSTPRLYRTDGRYVDIFRVPDERGEP